MLTAWGCAGKQDNHHDLLARVGEYTLSKQQLQSDMPTGLSDEEQIVFTREYVDNWISSILLYDVARKNLPDLERLDELAEAYRRDLFIYEYRKRLSDERLISEIPEDTLLQFYNENSERFTLHKPIVKGLFLKIPDKAQQQSSLQKWMKSATAQAVENIEKYAVKNAISYDYFLDHWVWFDDVKDNIPYDFGDDVRFLQQNKYFDVTHNDVVYMLHIEQYLKTGDIMPYEFARPRIQEILLNRRRVEFDRNLEQSLYKEALEDGQIVRYDTVTIDSVMTE